MKEDELDSYFDPGRAKSVDSDRNYGGNYMYIKVRKQMYRNIVYSFKIPTFAEHSSVALR